ncbi:MAG TPA: PAS domain-containing protein, partial [Chitinophagaceae bacterium]|nr:PAS domain-containing protein [Chitinophagaceae bacterium]
EVGSGKNYLGTGYMLLDDERLKLFNYLGEKSYQHIVEGLNAAVLFQDKAGEIIAVNQKVAELFDTTLERVYQIKDIKNLWDTTWNITTEKGEPISFEKTPFMQALQTGKMQSETLIIRLPDNESRWILFISQPLFDAGTTIPFSVVSNIVDVTTEKKLLNELKEREALLDGFMKRTPNIAWVVDEKVNLVFGSHSFFKYFGIKESESYHKKLADLVPEAIANDLYEKHIQVLKTDMPVETVEKIKWADGTSFNFHINIFPIEGIGGKKLTGGQAVSLADKYAVEKQLRDANDRLLYLSRAATNAIWEWDMLTGKIHRNEHLLDMIGYPMEETRGLSWWLRRIHPEDRNRISDKVKETTEKTQMSWEDQYRFKCADGSYKHIHDRGFVVYENGLPVKMIGSLQDVTALKELEDQLTQEKLQRQKRISEVVISVQEKERTRIGHELHDNVNQILSTVKLFVEMLTPSGEEEIKVKEKSMEYLSLAVEEVRKLSKELAAPELNEKSLVESINKIIDDIHISGALKIKLTYDFENDLPGSGEKITVFRIVQEQLKNILKHSGAKNAGIFLQYRDKNLKLVIKDDGNGFDLKQTHRGIGLSNIHERTRFYNGTVDIQTSPGQGCTLIVNIQC